MHSEANLMEAILHLRLLLPRCVKLTAKIDSHHCGLKDEEVTELGLCHGEVCDLMEEPV